MRSIPQIGLLITFLTLPPFSPAWSAPTTGPAEPQERSTEPTRSLAQLLAEGQELASDKCASCHSITKQGDSPNKAAPPFRTFAEKWPLESLEEALAEGIVTGHEQMPEFVFTPPQIDAFLTFLGSLQKDGTQKQGTKP